MDAPGWAQCGTPAEVDKKAYTLLGRGKFLALRKNLSLVVLHEGDPPLLDIYHIIYLSPAQFTKVSVAGGHVFADFLV
jgi:tungstate transport system substrate-binding protein